MSDKEIYRNSSKKVPQKIIEVVMEIIFAFQDIKVPFIMQRE